MTNVKLKKQYLFVLTVAVGIIFYCYLPGYSRTVSHDIFSKITLPVMSWRPDVDVTPGHITIIASGRLSNYGNITNKFFRLCEDAGFNVVQCGLDSSAHVINSINNARGTSMKLFMRKGLGTASINIPSTAYENPTKAYVSELQRIKPDNPFWSSFYKNWENHVSQVLDYSNECIARGEDDPLERIAGCMIYDEPSACYFWGLSEVSHRIWNIFKEKRPDVTPFIFGILFGNFTIGNSSKPATDPGFIRDLNRLSGGMNSARMWLNGYKVIENYKDYVDLYINMMNPALLSFDTYPFKTRNGEYVMSSMNQFFGTLVDYQNRKLNDKINFWVYVPCCKFVFANEKNGVKVATGDIIPSPTLGRMRFSAFVSLLYGATGITYWGVTESNVQDGFGSECPINGDGTTSETYDHIKTINTQIKGLEPILLSTDIALTSVTQKPPYSDLSAIPGINIHNENVGFGDVNKIETSGSGFVLAHMYNNSYNYILVVNMDSEKMQTATFSFLANDIFMSEGDDFYASWKQVSRKGVASSESLTFEPGDLKVFRYAR